MLLLQDVDVHLRLCPSNTHVLVLLLLFFLSAGRRVASTVFCCACAGRVIDLDAALTPPAAT